MAIKVVEAQLVLGGKDAGASAAVMQVVKAYEQAEKAGKGVSKGAEQVARALLDVEKQQAAVNAVMGARNGATTAEANLHRVTAAAGETKVALDKARAAVSAFDGQKAGKGTDLAKQMTEAAKAAAAAERAHRAAGKEVAQATRATEQQARALKDAERAAAAANVPLQALERHQAHLARAYDQTTEAMRRQVRVDEQAARAAAHHAKEQAEAARHMRQHGLVGAVGAVATGAVSVHGVTHVIEHAAKAGAEVQSTRVDMEKAGIGSGERQHITDESLKLAAKYKNVTQASVMELWKEMRSVMTDPHEVDHVIDPMVRAKSLLDAKDKTGTASHGLNLLVKGAEAIGAAKDPERFNKLLDGYLKAMQVMGSTVTPEGIYEMQKYSKASGGRWSDRFIMTTAQSLGQELGGSTAGNSIDIATKQIVGGMQNLHSKAKEFARIGLIDETNLDYLKTGEVKGTKAGVKHAVKGDDLAASDLDKWVYTVLLPALEKHGITSETDQLSWAQKNFTGTGANVIAKLIQQRESFEAHAKMYGDATGLNGVDLNREDPNAALGGLSKSLETFAGVMSSPIMVQAAHGLDAIAGGISAMSLRLDAFQKEHPDAAKAIFPAAATAGVIGSGAASMAMYKALSGGFGLKGSAVALDHSALALEAAAVRLGASGGLPGMPGEAPGNGATKGGKLKGALKAGVGIAAAFGLEPLAEAAQEHHIFEMPDVSNDGWLRSGLNFLDPNFGNAILGDRAKAIPSMVIKPAEAPLAIGRGTAAFGLDGALDPSAAAISGLPARLHPKMIDAEAAARDGAEAGQKAGDGIKAGIREKGPEIVDQAQSLFDRLQKVFSAGIAIPLQMSFGGEGMGGGSGIQSASFGGGGSGLGGLIRRASVGGSRGFTGGDVGGVSGGGGAGSARGISASDMRGINPEMAAYIRSSALAQGIDPNVALRIANSEGLRGSVPGVRNTPGDKGTSFGPFQLHYRSNIRGLSDGGLGDRYTQETGHHASDPKHWKEQIDFALRTARREGWGAWHGRYGAGIGTRDGIGTVRAVPMPRDGEPHLVRGLDGKEGLDLGNGTMKMPDGSIRSITKSGLEIPDAPKAGAGNGGMREHVAELGRHIDRLGDMSWRSHHTVAVEAAPGLTAKTKRMRIQTDGPVRGNVGVSMPQTEIG